MASRRYLSLTVILITICLDILSVFVVVVTALAGDLKTSRYDSYDLDKGPVFYEAYYPDTQNIYQEKRYYDRSTILERSFQVPSQHFTYSSISANQPITVDEQPNIANRRVSEEQQKIVELQRNHETTNRFLPSHDQRSTITEDNTKLQTRISKFSIEEEISKFIRKIISQYLNNQNTPEKYLNRSTNQDQLLPQAEIYSKESHKDKKDSSYAFQENWIDLNLSEQPSYKAPRNLETREVKQRPTYFEEIDASDNTMTKGESVNDMQATDKSINVISDSLSLENIFQPRPQLIRYKFFKKPMARVDERDKKIIDNSMPWNYDKLIPKETMDKSHGKLIKENVKVTSIQVSELPRHKTRHHHGEWPKRDYFAYNHRSSAGSKIA